MDLRRFFNAALSTLCSLLPPDFLKLVIRFLIACSRHGTSFALPLPSHPALDLAPSVTNPFFLAAFSALGFSEPCVTECSQIRGMDSLEPCLRCSVVSINHIFRSVLKHVFFCHDHMSLIVPDLQRKEETYEGELRSPKGDLCRKTATMQKFRNAIRRLAGCPNWRYSLFKLYALIWSVI